MNVKYARLVMNYVGWADICIHSLKKNSGPRIEKSSGLTPEVVKNLNIQGIPDKDIGIMYDPNPSYVGKKKKHWKRVGIWQGPTNMREIKKG